jgi:hypothetical protein
LIVDRGCRAGQVVYFVDLQVNRIDDVVANQLEAWMPQKMSDIVFAAGEKIVQAKNIMSFVEKPFTEM